ncbi:MAG: hypothetical protein LC744_02900 [Chloroflexi bacterium]|nr:hypothetical protein [Chloroflexota bacterium]
MIAPHQGHMMLSQARHAEHLATAERHRLAAGTLRPRGGTVHIQLHPRRVAAAVASMLLAIVVATGVAAAVNDGAGTPAVPNANTDGGGAGGGGGRVLHQ